jgi:hypothetical protein
LILEQRISNQVLDALYRIVHPQFNIFVQQFAFFVRSISLNANLLTAPGGSMREFINLLEE